MGDMAALVSAIAQLLWVFFAFAILILFKPHIAGLIDRVKRAKFPGGEVELREELKQLDKASEAAAKEVEGLPGAKAADHAIRQPMHSKNRAAGSVSRPPLATSEQIDEAIRTILEHAATAPQVALMLLSEELDRQIRYALATRGLLKGRSIVPLSQGLDELRRYGLPTSLVSSLSLFYAARNKIVHSGGASREDTLSAVDSGITILRAIAALPDEVNVVHHPGVDVFTDENCTNRITDAKGVILETVGPGRPPETFRIFPTTKTRYQKGKRVAWEWNMSRIWPEAWYRNPESGKIEKAWSSSAEFVGRHLEDV